MQMEEVIYMMNMKVLSVLHVLQIYWVRDKSSASDQSLPVHHDTSDES